MTNPMNGTADAVSVLGAPAIDEVGGWPGVLAAVQSGRPLTAAEARAAFTSVLTGEATPAQIAGLAMGMRTRGETPEELAAFLDVMVEHGVAVPLGDDLRARALCTCGTGGDRLQTVNVSTMAAFAVAGAGGMVCKHGGRAASSLAGSADVLEALGVTMEVTAEGAARCVAEVGYGFCLAPRFHPAMRHAAPVRRELGVPTFFNLLGPMANPGRVERQIVGVPDPRFAPVVAQVLARRRARRALVVRGDDGLDELSTTTTSKVWWVEHGEVRDVVVDPRALGFAPATIEQLRGGTASENASIARRVLDGELGPVRDIVVLNAGAGLVAAGVEEDFAEGCAAAAEAIDAGRARAVLDGLVRLSAEVRERSAQ